MKTVDAYGRKKYSQRFAFWRMLRPAGRHAQTSFHSLGYTPVHLAFLFVLYECCGVVTNLFGGWIGSRMGVRVTLFAGLALQIVALLMLSGVQTSWAQSLSVVYVMAAQALSGIAKDLTKMSSKSAVKLVVSGDGENELQAALFKWVAVLTGSKNALKGCGFLLGGVLLSWLGFAVALWAIWQQSWPLSCSSRS